MGKTKTQAQKRLEREARIKEAEEKRSQEKAAHALECQRKQREENHEKAEPLILSKKALRKQKREGVQQQIEYSSKQAEKEDFSLLSTEKSCLPNSNTDHESKKLMNRTREEALENSEKEKQSFFNEKKCARTVQNHSSYCEGLKPVLARLAKDLSNCTIIPGEISQSKSNEYPQLVLLFQRMSDEHNYKFVARRGHTVQDVLISVPDSQVYTEEFVCECIEKAIKGKVEREDEEILEPDEIAMSSYNRIVAANRQGFWKGEHQEKHKASKEREKEIKKEEKIKKRSRILATKRIPSAEREQYAKRDEDIVSGKQRGKCGMN